MKKQKELIRQAHENVCEQIKEFSKRSEVASAMAGEGYNGGYRDALNDVILVLNGILPDRNGWWNKRGK